MLSLARPFLTGCYTHDLLGHLNLTKPLSVLCFARHDYSKCLVSGTLCGLGSFSDISKMILPLISYKVAASFATIYLLLKTNPVLEMKFQCHTYVGIMCNVNILCSVFFFFFFLAISCIGI